MARRTASLRSSTMTPPPSANRLTVPAAPVGTQRQRVPMLLGPAYGRGMSSPPRVEPDSGLAEVADRVWVTRRGPADVVSTVVAGASGMLLVDAGWSVPAGDDLLAAVRRPRRGGAVGAVR